MGAKRRAADRAGRPAMRSPGRPSVGRLEHRQRFWAAIARGVSSEEAAAAAGVSAAVGVRWFREGGGMPTVTLAAPSGRYLSFTEREEIAMLRAGGSGVREIAVQLGRSPSTISRELRRNAATRSGGFEYRATTAQWHADRRARRPKPAKLAVNAELRRYVQERLSGTVQRPGGIAVGGPEVRWIGRRHGRRADRRWARAWSPEQISNRLRLDFPDDVSMRVSHEAIYQSLYVQGRGALRRELTACLRTGRALRAPRARVRGRGKGFVTDEVMISQRPAEAQDRAVPGHWEGDLILGLGSSAIGTLVERSSRFTMLLHLPPMDGRDGPRVKNGPAMTGHGAAAVRDAIADAITALPDQLRRSLTWDQGAEMAQHAQLRIDTGLQVYFCDPQSPWQRGPTRTPTGCCASTSPRAQILPGTASTISSPSPPP
jgi:IS30 family transposase